MEEKKIVFVLPTLTAGGAERVISFVAQHIDKNTFKSHLLILGSENEAAYTVKDINLTFLNKKRVLHAIPQLFWFLIEQRPNIVVSSIGHLNTIMGLLSVFFLKTKFIIREASVISAIRKFGKSNRLRHILSKVALLKTNYIICQSKDMASDFKKIYNVPDKKIVVINNPITTETDIKSQNSDLKVQKYITVGRLSKEKGHSRILDLLSKSEKDFHYTIIGTGPEEKNVLDQISELNFEKKVTHIPFAPNVDDYLKTNDLFLQGSYVEGFPNAVLESCAVGTPVIAFNVPGGTKEIIEHDVNGYLVETEDQYLKYLNISRVWNPINIHESVNKKFSKKTILQKYETLFNKV